MDTPDSKPSGSNSNLSLTVSSTGSILSDSSLNDLGRRSITPDLISSGSTSGSSSSSNTTISSYGSSASGKCFRLSNVNFQRVGSQNSGSESPCHTTFGDSASQNTPPPIVISPPRQESIDGSTPPPSPVPERVPHGLRTNLAQRLLSFVDSGGRPIRLVKRSALKDITNIAKTRPSIPGDHECIEDAPCLVYRSSEDFLPIFVSTPPTCNAPYSDSAFFGPSSRFGDMFSPNVLPSTTPTFALPESFNSSGAAGPIARTSSDIVTSLAAKYQHEYTDDYEDDIVMGERYEWEDEMHPSELSLGFYDKET